MKTEGDSFVYQSICSAQDALLKRHQESLLFGLGVNDPKRVFGTTKSLVEKYGIERVFETPTSENSSLGLAVGLAISGFKPIVVHQRIDFFLLAMDQLINAAAKWRFMFGDQYETPMIIRLIAGRGWGQGPTHSQNLHALFAHIPGLRVLFPTFARDFVAVFENAFSDKYPVIVIEDRWIHQSNANIELIGDSIKRRNWYSARVIRHGTALTLISFGFNTLLCSRVSSFFEKLGIEIELIDLVSIKPIDFEALFLSVNKTGRAVIVDSGFEVASVGSYIAFKISNHCFAQLKAPVDVVSSGDFPEPTSHGIIDDVKINALGIAKVIAAQLGVQSELDQSDLQTNFVDVPNSSLFGPF